MTRLRFHATLDETGQLGNRYPVFVVIYEALDDESSLSPDLIADGALHYEGATRPPEVAIGHLSMPEHASSAFFAMLGLLSDLAVASGVPIQYLWSGWQPPPTDLPVDRIRKVMRMFGLK